MDDMLLAYTLLSALTGGRNYDPLPEDLLVQIRQNALSCTQFQCKGGWAILATYSNGYTADIAKNPMTYGSDNGLWEGAVINRDGEIVETDLAYDVRGFMTDEQVVQFANDVSKLDATGHLPEGGESDGS